MPRPLLLSTILSCFLAACASPNTEGGAGARTRTNADVDLVVLITVDQLRPDYAERFAPHLSGGIRRIRNEGAWFPNGRQNHAIPETAPGHASLLSGRYPASTGIFANSRGVGDPNSPLVQTAGDGASPHRFRGTSLFDWMRAADRNTRVLSVSRKDRGAILPVGNARTDVYWYANGMFTTSSYYADTLPAWLRDFNSGIDFSRWHGAVWRPLLADSLYQRSTPGEPGEPAFAYAFPEDTTRLPTVLIAVPWMDSVTLALALRGTHELRLGRRGSTDLLLVSLSTLDGIGHAHGPESAEVQDHFIRMDRWLGAFMDSLAQQVPVARTLFVLASDHGVAAMPEYLVRMGQRGGRVSMSRVVRPLGQQLVETYAVDPGLGIINGLVMADVEALRAAKVNVDSLADAFAAALLSTAGVRRVITPSAMRAAGESDAEIALWRRTIPPGTGWLVAAMTEPGFVFTTARQADHSTWQHESVLVPIAFLGPAIPRGVYEREIDTVDIGVTLAALLGVTPRERVDGKVIGEITGGTNR